METVNTRIFDGKFLGCPGAKDLMVTRKYPRFPKSCPIVMIQGPGLRFPGMVRNLSLAGCRITSLIQTFNGMQLHLNVEIGETGSFIVKKAVVRWSGSAGMGLEFLQVDQSENLRLVGEINRLETESAHVV